MLAQRQGSGGSAGNAGSAGRVRDADATCNTCGKKGHRTRHCPEAICNECGEKGHIRRDCKIAKKKKASAKKGATAAMFKQFEAFCKQRETSGGDADSDSESMCSNASHRSAAGSHMAVTQTDSAAEAGDADDDYTWGIGGY